MEKLKSAVYFGADAVYLAGKAFGMRAASGNFTDDGLRTAVSYCHERGVKVYVTVNIMPRDGEYQALEEYFRFLRDIGADAAIISDIGAVALCRSCAPGLDIHISTQASTVSAHACMAWHSLGASRIVLARELSLESVAAIRRALPPEIELECFVHGSMCVAYSGRCLLSQYFSGRDANRGACAQPCRWIYSDAGDSAFVRSVAEEKRPGDVLDVVQDGGESFVMSSKDMCMIEHIPELCMAGISSFKLEGRVRSAYYTAVVTNTYKMALDKYIKDPENYSVDSSWLEELNCVSHREYSTGFFFGDPHREANLVSAPGYIREKAYIATAVEDSGPDGTALFMQRNKLSAGDDCALLSPGKCAAGFKASELFDENGDEIKSAPHPMMRFRLRVPFQVHAGDILRGD